MNARITLDALNSMRDNMLGHLDISFTALGPDFLEARMPVDHRTRQPMGLLHGGASVVLAETLGSAASLCLLDMERQYPVGLEINANHLKAVREGFVTGRATPIHLGRRTHVWDVRICDERQQLVCVCRMTVAVMDKETR